MKFNNAHKLKTNSGLTLLELLITTAILGIIMIGLHQVMGTALSAYDSTKEKQDLLAQARFAMERMVMFVQETDYILKPDDVYQEILKASERALDTYNNGDHSYNIDGDGTLDADNDSDGLVNDDETDDPKDMITFDLDKTDPGNWKLQEQMPDYSTPALDDFMANNVICEHVTAFKCSRLSFNLVEIELTLNNGNSEVSLKTRVKARLIEL
ncbi:MAG: prepilin-type N-terminal cleavage/methylation domain-containing protein [Desulfobacterales bacterium]|nr:prepilin-type N-terminal cleavage/methylation domain-containing protein [Desulfobacterales bacterium]